MNFGERMAKLRKRRKGKKAKKNPTSVRRAAARVNRSAAAAKKTAKRAPKRRKHQKAHKVYARDVGARLRRLEDFKERQERWNVGVSTWASGINAAVRSIYGLTGHALPKGRKALPKGR